MVYDINAQRRSLSVSGHAEDGKFSPLLLHLNHLANPLSMQLTPSASQTIHPPTSLSLVPMMDILRSGIDDLSLRTYLPVSSSALLKVSLTLRPKVTVGI